MNYTILIKVSGYEGEIYSSNKGDYCDFLLKLASFIKSREMQD